MEALTLYQTKQLLDESFHLKTVAYVENDPYDYNNKVWLTHASVLYKTLIHGWYKIDTDNTRVRIIRTSAGFNSARAALLIKVTYESGSIRHQALENNPADEIVLNAGLYKIDYEILMENDGEYSAALILADSGLTCGVSFLLVDGTIRRIRYGFPGRCNKLTGVHFTELNEDSEGYAEMVDNIERQLLEVPNTPLDIDLNLVYVAPHIQNDFTRLRESSYTLQGFLPSCVNIGNVDLSDNTYIKTTRFILRGCSNLPDNLRKTILKVGPYITLLENRDLHKILRVDIIDKDGKESPFEWDSSINCVIARQLILDSTTGEYRDNNWKYVYTSEDAEAAEGLTPEDLNYSKYYKKRIIDAGGVFPNNYLEIPSGYIIQNYYAFTGRKIDVLNMYNFDGIANLLLVLDRTPFASTDYFVTPVAEGRCDLIRASNNELQELPENLDCYWYNNRFHIPVHYFRLFDIHDTKTIILPKNILWLGLWRFSGGGWSNIERIVVPNQLAPIVPWGSEYDSWYGTSAEDWSHLYGYSYVNSGDWGPRPGIYDKPRTLYILKDDYNQIDPSWTNEYDRTTPIISGKGVRASSASIPMEHGSWEDNGVNTRPNTWHDITLSTGDEGLPETSLNTRKRALNVFWKMNIQALSEQEMDALVENIISETTNNS